MKNFPFIILLFAVSSLFAQDYGGLKGRITDEFSGDPLQFAKLSLQINGALVAQVQADKDGDFAFRNISEGIYDLVIHKVGFSPIKVTDIIIIPSQDLEFNPTFEGEGYDQDTLVFTYAEMQTLVPIHNFPSSSDAQKRITKKHQQPPRRTDLN